MRSTASLVLLFFGQIDTIKRMARRMVRLTRVSLNQRIGATNYRMARNF